MAGLGQNSKVRPSSIIGPGCIAALWKSLIKCRKSDLGEDTVRHSIHVESSSQNRNGLLDDVLRREI